MLIDRYIVREILRPVILGVGLFLLVYTGFSLSKNLAMAADGLIDMLTALKLVGLSSITTLEIILPTSMFFSVLFVMGRLYQNGEIAVLASVGVSPLRLLGSVGMAALLIATVVALLSVFGRPWAYDSIYRLEGRAISQLDASNLSAGRFVSLDDDGYMFIADERAEEEGLHRKVFLFQTHLDEDGASYIELIRAETARLPRLDPGQEALLTFGDGYSYLLDQAGETDWSMRFAEMNILWGAAEEAREKYRNKATPTFELARSTDPKDIAEYQWRLSTPLAGLLLALLAFPLARSRPRASQTRGNLLAVAAYLLIFTEITVVRTLVEQGSIPAVPGLWLAYLLPLALLLGLMLPGARLRPLRLRGAH